MRRGLDGEEKADILAADAMATLATATVIITIVCQLAMPDAQGVRRIAAAVVADDALDDGALLEALRASVDPVFLPRRIIRVPALPRNETGKLPREAVAALLRRA